MLEIRKALVSMFEDHGVGKLMAYIVIDMLDEDHVYEMLRKDIKILKLDDSLNPEEIWRLKNKSDGLAPSEVNVSPTSRRRDSL